MQHDLGGQDFGEIVVTDRPLSFWEFSIHALLVILAQKNPSLMTTDELRRSVEALEPNAYSTWGYYEKWSAAMTHILLERGVITQDELDAELLGNSFMIEPTLEPSFQVGDIVQVKSEDTRVRWRKPHLRCPGYVFNCVGVIEKYIGKFDDPFLLAFRGHGPQQHLYCVSFYLRDIWPEGCNQSFNDKVTLDVYEGWLMSAAPQTKPAESASPINSGADLDTYDHHSFDHHHGHDHDHDHQLGHHDDQTHPHDHSHGHEHDHGHLHETRVEIECKSIEKEGEETPGKLVGEAVLRTLFKKGIVTEQQVRDVVMKLEGLSSRLAGADLVVKAWMDPEYKARLLENAPLAAAEIEIATSNANAPTILRVVECTPQVHHICVCTLCSCYPSGLLGISPSWCQPSPLPFPAPHSPPPRRRYRSRSYRARTVREPRKVLESFGTRLPEEVEIQVHDSTADCRFLVLPLRPKGTEDWTAEQLRAIVTRDSMVGVSVLSL